MTYPIELLRKHLQALHGKLNPHQDLIIDKKMRPVYRMQQRQILSALTLLEQMHRNKDKMFDDKE